MTQSNVMSEEHISVVLKIVEELLRKPGAKAELFREERINYRQPYGAQCETYVLGRMTVIIKEG